MVPLGIASTEGGRCSFYTGFTHASDNWWLCVSAAWEPSRRVTGMGGEGALEENGRQWMEEIAESSTMSSARYLLDTLWYYIVRTDYSNRGIRQYPKHFCLPKTVGERKQVACLMAAYDLTKLAFGCRG